MSFDRLQTPRWRQGYRFQYEPAQKGHVLLYPEGMIKLNESASAIGGLIDGQRSVAAIIANADVPDALLAPYREMGIEVVLAH